MWLLTSIFDQRLTEISVIVGIISAVSALPIFKSISKWSRNRRQSKDERLTAAIEKANKPMIAAYEQEHRDTMERLGKQENASLASLHDRIYQEGTRLLDKGWASVDEIDNFSHLYQPYRDLGGNGTGEAMFKRVMDLPLSHEKDTLVQEAADKHKEREARK